MDKLKVDITSKMSPAGIEPTATAWKAVMLTLHPRTLIVVTYLNYHSTWLIKPTTTQLRVVRSNDWPNWADAYLQLHFYHSHTNIYSDPATWNQWFYLHWSNLILSYQHIWKTFTLQWCPIEDTDPLHQFLAFNLLNKGCPKHMVTYGYQCRCLHWSIWHIIHIYMVRECTEELSAPIRSVVRAHDS